MVSFIPGTGAWSSMRGVGNRRAKYPLAAAPVRVVP
jgi:hypothetical protein